MNKFVSLLKPLMPILAAAYGTALIYITAWPTDSDSPGFGGELLSWLLTLAGIGLTLFLVQRVESKLFPTARQFQIKSPVALVIIGLLFIAPLWFVAKEYIIYGLTRLVHFVDGTVDLLGSRTARGPAGQCSCRIACSNTRRTMLQANGHFALPQP